MCNAVQPHTWFLVLLHSFSHFNTSSPTTTMKEENNLHYFEDFLCHSLAAILWIFWTKFPLVITIRSKWWNKNKLLCDAAMMFISPKTDVLILKCAVTNGGCGMSAAGTVSLVRGFNGIRGLAHTSLGKTKVNTSLLLSCECATPAECFKNHQLEIRQGWFQYGERKKTKKQTNVTAFQNIRT